MAQNKVFKRFQKAWLTLTTCGVSGLVKHIMEFLHYSFKNKWQFTYFELSLDETPYTLPEIDDSITIRMASREDIPKIQTDLYPHLTPIEEYDKQYINQIGEDNIKLFVAEKDGKFVHYFLLFTEALYSPLIGTPIDKSKVSKNDAYMGTTFTIPEARGLWIVPHTILKILSFLKSNTNLTRVIVLVHKETPGAIDFYKRLGFKVIKDAYPSGGIASLMRKIFKP